jgi:deferrochelatase/peroxidase EfeB
MRHHPRRPGEALGRDHFGYVDGVSQPSLEAEQAVAQYWRDKVEPGEILLGYANNRGDAPHGGDAVLDNGSFLVVRKLRQHTELFEARLKLAVKSLLPKGDKAARARLHEMLMAKLMGRHANGKPLTTQKRSARQRLQLPRRRARRTLPVAVACPPHQSARGGAAADDAAAPHRASRHVLRAATRCR